MSLYMYHCLLSVIFLVKEWHVKSYQLLAKHLAIYETWSFQESNGPNAGQPFQNVHIQASTGKISSFEHLL